MNGDLPDPGPFTGNPTIRGKVLVIGAAVLDRIFYVDQLPRTGETAIGDRMEKFPGGKGANQALAVARTGAEVRFFSAVGEDYPGDYVLTPLREAGVDVERVMRVPGVSTAETVISVDAKGENQIVACPGAYHKIGVEHIDSLGDMFEWADWLLIQNELPRMVVDRAIHKALEAGVKVIFNAAPFRPHTPPPPRDIHILVANEVEAAGLLGVSDYFSITPAKRGPSWKYLGAENILVTLGRNGGEWFDDNGKRHEFAAPQVPRVVDTVGAGDAFCGIVAALLAEGRGIEEATRIAHIGAGLSIEKEGAQTGLPSRESLLVAVEKARYS